MNQHQEWILNQEEKCGIYFWYDNLFLIKNFFNIWQSDIILKKNV